MSKVYRNFFSLFLMISHFKAFLHQRLQQTNFFAINWTFLNPWGWLHFLVYPNSRRESLVGVTPATWQFSASQGGKSLQELISLLNSSFVSWYPSLICLNLMQKDKSDTFLPPGTDCAEILILRLHLEQQFFQWNYHIYDWLRCWFFKEKARRLRLG